MVGVTLNNKFQYRGNDEYFANQYWFTGGTPSGPTAWRALFDALVAQHKTVLSSVVTVVGGYGHTSNAVGAVADWSVDLTVSPDTPVAGTLTVTGSSQMPGDDSVWVRWRTSRVTSPGGKPIYLRKYFHPAYTATGGGDNILTAQKTALLALGAKMRDGTFLDGRTLTAPGHVDTLTSHGASSYVTTRTLKRRSKRAHT